MTNKIFRSTIFVAAVVLLCSLGIIMGVLYGYFNDVQITQLRDELSLAAIGTEENGLSYSVSLGSMLTVLLFMIPMLTPRQWKTTLTGRRSGKQ